MGHVDVAGVRYELPDGRCSSTTSPSAWGRGRRWRGRCQRAGKTTLLRIITGELVPHGGAVTRSGGLA